MNNEELLPVNIVIGDRTYRIKIEAGDEEAVRRTVKTINDKIIEFKTNFAGKDMQDYIAMVMIWYATLQTKDTLQQMQKDELAEKLGQLEKMLGEVGD